MINPQNSDLRVPRPPSGIFRLFTEAFKTIKSNRKTLLQVLVSVHLIQPVVRRLVSQLMERSQLFQDRGNNMHQPDYSSPIEVIGEVLLVNIFILQCCLIAPLLFLVATASSSPEDNSPSKLIDLKEMILKINRSRNKIILFIFHMCLLAMDLIFVRFITSVLATPSWKLVIYGGLLLLLIVYELYVSALGVVSLVVLAFEDVGGLDAIVRAREVMKGKNIEACLIMVLFGLAYGLVHSHAKWSQLTVLIHLSKGLLSTLKLFVFVVFTVFYLEQNERCNEK